MLYRHRFAYPDIQNMNSPHLSEQIPKCFSLHENTVDVLKLLALL